MTFHYLPADEVTPGDILPDISHDTVTRIDIFPNESARAVFGHGAYVRHFPYGGPDFGYPAVRIERN
jgi:hypothetical protein